MAKIEVELSVNGIDEGYFLRFEDGTGMFYSEERFKDYLNEQMECGNEILLKPADAHK